MRAFTQRETELFEMAYKCIGRVVAVTYTTEDLFEIKEQDRESKQIKLLHESIREMFQKAGVAYMRNMFCDVNKNKAIEVLKKKFLKDGIQPSEYFVFGLLVIKKVRYETTHFSSFNEKGIE